MNRQFNTEVTITENRDKKIKEIEVILPGLDSIADHWLPVYWKILWDTQKIPRLIFHETDRLDDNYFAVCGWWQPIPAR